MDVLIDVILLGMLAVTAVAIVRVRNLFAVALLSGIYSLLSAGLFTTMDAADVAFTEAAVGAGIATILLLGTLVLVGTDEARSRHTPVLPLAVVLVTGAMLVYGTLDLPAFGEPDNPAHVHVAPRYVHETPEAIGIPNVVTAVLASYRGFDTMGETTVVFAAVVGVLLLLGSGRHRRDPATGGDTQGSGHGRRISGDRTTGSGEQSGGSGAGDREGESP